MYHFENILAAFIFIIAHGLLFFFNYKIFEKRIMQPAVLFSLLWFIILLLHFIFSFTILNELPPLSISTYLIFFVGVITFSLGAFLQTFAWQKKNINKIKSAPVSTEEISTYLKYILLILAIIGLPFFIKKMYQIFIASNLDNFLVGLRTEISYGDADLGIVKYFFAFSLVTYAFILQSYLKQKNLLNTILLILSFLVALTYAIFTTGRLLFLFILAVYLGMKFIHGKTSFTIKRTLIFVVFFITVFMIFGVIYGKGGSTESNAVENIIPATQSTAIYLVSPLNALQYQLHDQLQINYNGSYSLRFFIKLAKSFNLISNREVKEVVQPFVFIPYPTNVYTGYSAYIKDFGKLYAWVIYFFLGMFHSYLYNKAIEKKNFRNSFWYSLMLFPLIVSFFDDQYFSAISIWIQFAVFIEITILLNKLFLLKKYKQIQFSGK